MDLCSCTGLTYSTYSTAKKTSSGNTCRHGDAREMCTTYVFSVMVVGISPIQKITDPDSLKPRRRILYLAQVNDLRTFFRECSSILLWYIVLILANPSGSPQRSVFRCCRKIINGMLWHSRALTVHVPPSELLLWRRYRIGTSTSL